MVLLAAAIHKTSQLCEIDLYFFMNNAIEEYLRSILYYAHRNIGGLETYNVLFRYLLVVNLSIYLIEVKNI